MLNVHPVLVHFPIGLLTIYALVELTRIRRIQEHPHTFTLKAFLLVTGALSLAATYQSGELIESAFAAGDLELLVERHATFALASYVIFAVLAIGYFIKSALRLWPEKSFWKTLFGASLSRLAHSITSKYIAPCFAFFGLIALTITGALGGAIVHGPEIDPAVSFIYHLFVR
jgi:uncharacterized membrane protein